jgi:hypothetical protein
LDAKRDSHSAGLITGAAAARIYVRRGDCVEVNYVIDAATGHRERFWVAVESIADGVIDGVLLNGPIFINGGFADVIKGVPVQDVLAIHAGLSEREIFRKPC